MKVNLEKKQKRVRVQTLLLISFTCLIATFLMVYVSFSWDYYLQHHEIELFKPQRQPPPPPQQQQTQSRQKRFYCESRNDNSSSSSSTTNNSLLNAAPTFIIAGVQKGGTSALRGILVQHPKMIASRDFEPHFFDKKIYQFLSKNKEHESLFRRPSTPTTTTITTTTTTATGPASIPSHLLCSVQRHYIQSLFPPQVVLDASYANYFFFEKTPSYLVDPNVPYLISQVCSSWDPKIIVLLRNPIDRAYSHYKMEREKLRVKESFESVIRQELDYMRQIGLTTAPLIPTNNNNNNNNNATDIMVQSLLSGTESISTSSTIKLLSSFQLPQHLQADQATSDRLHQQLMMNRTNTNFLQRGLYAPQLQRWLSYFPIQPADNRDHDHQQHRLLVLRFEEMQLHPTRIYKEILDFLQAPYHPLDPTNFEKAYKTRGQYRRKNMIHPPMSNATRHYLELFYEPYNKLLEQMLGRSFY